MNSNIRCIEMVIEKGGAIPDNVLNSNIRCIEMSQAIDYIIMQES